MEVVVNVPTGLSLSKQNGRQPVLYAAFRKDYWGGALRLIIILYPRLCLFTDNCELNIHVYDVSCAGREALY